jgi:hypothetical protein
MSLATRSLPGRIEPSRVYFGSGECTKVTAVADIADSLGGTYFTINVPASVFDSSKTAVEYYVWLDNGADPAPAGKTGITVDITTNDDAETVAAAIETALNGLATKRFRVERTGAELLIENREIGSVTATADVDTGFTFSQEAAGFGGDLGSTTSDGIELSFESESVPITSLQTGNLVLDNFYLGGAISLSLGLQEMDINTWELALKSTGSTFTPVGGTKVAGIGEATLFRSFLATGGQLTLKPLSTADGDNSRNHTFWKAAPQPESINFNNDIQALQVSFQALLDPSRDTRVNAYMFGDNDQDGLA